MKLAALALAFAAAVPSGGVPYDYQFQRVAWERWPERAAQVWQESRFNPMAENPISHAKGLAQFMDPTWRESQDRGVVPRTASPFDPEWAIIAQHDYMNRQEAFARRTLPGVDAWIGGLACFNWGPGNWRKAVRRADAAGARGSLGWVRFCPAESQNYIVVIPAKAREYRAQRGL